MLRRFEWLCLSILAYSAMFVGMATVFSTCRFWGHQPKMPEELMQYMKMDTKDMIRKEV